MIVMKLSLFIWVVAAFIGLAVGALDAQDSA